MREPREQMAIRSFACLYAGEVKGRQILPHASEDREVVREFGAFLGAKDASPGNATRRATRRLVEDGGVELVHFVGYGSLDHVSPWESGIVTVDGLVFRAEDLIGPLGLRVLADRPFVFLNSTIAGYGWAEAWVRNGCGAFVGPQWNVDRLLAAEFVSKFYSTLKKEGTVGYAARSAREHVRTLNPRNPAWLAFAVFAHPNGCFRSRQGEEDS